MNVDCPFWRRCCLLEPCRLIVTIYETWIHFYDPETKQQIMEWKHSWFSGFPSPKWKNDTEYWSKVSWGVFFFFAELRIQIARYTITIYSWSKVRTLPLFIRFGSLGLLSSHSTEKVWNIVNFLEVIEAVEGRNIYF